MVLEILKLNPSALRFVSAEFQNDYEIVMTAVKVNGFSLKYASDILKGNRQVVTQAVMTDGFALDFASSELMNDIDLQKMAIRNNPNMFSCLVNKLTIFEIENEVLELALHLHGKSLALIPNTFHNYRDLVLLAVKNDGKALSHATETLKADREIVWEAVSQNGFALFYASPELKKDREIILKALETSSTCYLSLPIDFQEDLEIIQQTLRYFPNALQFIRSTNLDIQFLTSVVEKNPLLLKYASRVRKDKNLVLKSVELDGNNLQYADSELRQDPELILKAAQQNIKSLVFAKNMGKELLIELSEMNGFLLDYVWNQLGELKTDRDFIIACLKRNGRNFIVLDQSMRDDREILNIALETFGTALYYSDKRFRYEYEMVKKAVRDSPDIHTSIPRVVIDREIVKTILSVKGILFHEFYRFNNDIELVMTAVKQNGKSFKYASENIVRDPEVQTLVVKESGFCFQPNAELFQSRMEHCYFGAYQYEHLPFYPFNNYPMEYFYSYNTYNSEVRLPDYSELLKPLQK
ncbi:predicted protein [Naegleria gruberi]|uniref:Predicted protein n=1 Tax=Naegleria gruberi TaxID=5762 RepID=D2VEA2_NAEGR|nr:uncharacterized protein NAEGRDRAFT_48850 [Naegleria gruberi]EFC44761.1 predicted protein [Naegleria gruberi]|eukprot:XP_002677505.1 predicted protein [Naegleria gruberi strain NEG-M]